MAHPILVTRPGFTASWEAFVADLIKWCGRRGSFDISEGVEGFTVENSDDDFPWVQFVRFDEDEDSVYFAASWQELSALEINVAIDELSSIANDFDVPILITEHEDVKVLEWWGPLSPAVKFFAYVLDNLKFELQAVSNTYLIDPGPLSSAASVRAHLEELEAEKEAERQFRLNRPATAPDPQPYGVSHEGAEHLSAAWMRHLGVLDAEVTAFSGDGGIDVDSLQFVAQVKNYTGAVPVEEIRALFGVATIEGKRAVLFTSGILTAAGAEFADRAGIIVIQYNAVEGTLRGLNDLGRKAVAVELTAALNHP